MCLSYRLTVDPVDSILTSIRPPTRYTSSNIIDELPVPIPVVNAVTGICYFGVIPLYVMNPLYSATFSELWRKFAIVIILSGLPL